MRAREHEQRVRIEVENEDRSLVPDDLPGIRRRFAKKDSARSRSPGSGLGLAMVGAICRQAGYGHGCSKSGTRLVFWLDLPVADRAPVPG